MSRLIPPLLMPKLFEISENRSRFEIVPPKGPRLRPLKLLSLAYGVCSLRQSVPASIVFLPEDIMMSWRSEEDMLRLEWPSDIQIQI